MNVSQILEGAADAMEKHGHCREGAWIDDDGSCCIGGAIAYATGNTEFLPLTKRTVTNGSNHRTPAWEAMVLATGGPHIFNRDHPAHEVIAMLRAVAATERAREARLLPVVRELEPS